MGERMCSEREQRIIDQKQKSLRPCGRGDFLPVGGLFSYPHLHWQPQPITGADPDEG